MAEGSGSALREVLVELGFDLDKKSEADIHSAIGKIKSAAVALGVAFGTSKVVGFINDTVAGVAALGDEIGETAQKIGVSADSLQTLGFIAKDSGASMEDMGTAMRFISKNAVAAKDGSAEMQASFRKLGVSVTDSSGRMKTADELFTELADGFVNVKDPAERTALAMKVLGRSGTQLIPTLLKGSDALREEAERARELGFVMDDELLELGDAFERAQHEQTGAVQGLRNAFARELLPAFIAGSRAMTNLIVRARPLVRVLAAGLARAMELIGKVMAPLVRLFESVASRAGGLADTIAALVDPIELIGVAIVGIASLLAAKALIMAASWLIGFAPVLLIIVLLGIIGTAIGLVIQDLIAMGEGADSVSGTMIQGFMDLVDQLGSIPMAMREMLFTVIDYWVEFFTGQKFSTDEFITYLIEQMAAGWDSVATYAKEVWQGIVDFVMGIVNKITGAVGSVVGFAGKIAGVFGGGNPAGVATADAMGGSSGGTTNNVSQGGASVDVKVDAGGSAATADDIGSAVAAHVSAALERENRKLMGSVTVSPP